MLTLIKGAGTEIRGSKIKHAPPDKNSSFDPWGPYCFILFYIMNAKYIKFGFFYLLDGRQDCGKILGLMLFYY